MMARAKDGCEEIKQLWLLLAPHTSHTPSNVVTKKPPYCSRATEYEDGREGRGVTRDRRAMAAIPDWAR